MSGSRDRVPPVSPGERVRQYEIIDEIGRGGMGIVFRARDTGLGRQVAMKCPWPDLAADPDHRGRFIREVKVESRLSHPNIVPLFEAFEELGVPWLVMQHISGQSLRGKLVQDGKLPVGRVLRYGEELVSALQHAHESGVLHRDINPQNIIVSREDRCYLTDFGLAKFVHTATVGDSTVSTDTEPMTSRGVVMGTPHYMAPEQTLGHELDERSDVFSMGLVFYEMCTGHQAFNGSERGALFDAILHREPDPIKRYTYEIPDELEAVVRKCINKRPDERYQSAREIGADLRRLRRTSIAREVTETDPSFIAAPKKPSRWGYILPAVAAIAITAGLAWFFLPREEAPMGTPVQLTGGDAWESEPAISPDGSRLAFTSNVEGNLNIYVMDIRGGDPLQLTSHEAKDSQPSWLPDGSGLLFTSERGGVSAIWRIGAFGGSPGLVLENAFYPSVSPDGEWLAFSRPNPIADLRIFRTPFRNPGEVVPVTGDDDGVFGHHGPTWSPNGEWISYTSQDNVWVAPVRGNEPPRALLETTLFVRFVSWSSDGKNIFFSSSQDGTTAIWRVAESGGEPTRITMGGGRESQPNVSADGTRLAYTTEGGDHDLLILDRQTDEYAEVRGLRDEWMPSFAPDMSRVVYASDSRGGRFDIWSQELRDGKPVGTPARLTDHEGNASHPVVSPDGRWVAYYRALDNRRDIYVVPAAGGRPFQITDNIGADYHPAWSPDSRALAFSSDRDGGSSDLYVVAVENGQALSDPQLIAQGPVGFLAPRWSPDGNRIACVGMDDAPGDDVWILSSEASEPPRRLAVGAVISRLHWGPGTDDLWISSVSGGKLGLYQGNPDTGEFHPARPAIDFGADIEYGHFDISHTGRYLVFSRMNPRGDIWVLEANPGTY